jgi:hypothetical protein
VGEEAIALMSARSINYTFHLSSDVGGGVFAGDIAAVKDEKGVKRKSQAPFLQKNIPGAYNVGDWRLPSSPAIALMFAQDDIRERLNLQSKSKVLSTKLSM